MTHERKSYRTIVSSLSIFGSLQVFSSILSLVRGKLVAVLTGAEGMGILGLLNGLLGILSGLGGLGLETSSVKYLSEYEAKGDTKAVAHMIAVVRGWGLLAGLCSAVVVALAASWMAQLTFGDPHKQGLIFWLSAALLCKILSSTQLAILQGVRRIKELAMANFLGNLAGFVVIIPLLYYKKIDAIAPSLAVSAVCGLLFSMIYTRRLASKGEKLSTREIFREGSDIVRLGLSFGVAGLAALAAQYAVQLYLNHNGTLAEVGYYSAGMTFLNSYVGILFTAMSADYFPRLSAVHDEPVKIRELLTQQAITGVLVLLPVIVWFAALSGRIVTLVFSSDFTSIVPFLVFGMLGMLFRAVSFSIGYIVLAKADSRLFIKTSIFFNILFFLLLVAGYEVGNLTGMGMAFAVYYLLHLLILVVLVRKRYSISFGAGLWSIFTLSFLFCALSLLVTFTPKPWNHLMGVGLAVAASVFAFRELDRRIGLRDLFFSKFKKPSV